MAFDQRASCLTKSMGCARRAQGQAKTCRAETSNCPRGFCIADGSPLRLLLGKRRLGRLFGAIHPGGADPRSTLPALRVRSFVRPIRPSWSCGQPVFDHHFNAGHPFAEHANFGPELVNFGPEHVNFSLDTSDIFAHVAAEFIDLAANV